MHRIHFGGARIAVIAALLVVPQILVAQDDPSVAERIRALEERLDALTAQADEIRRELDELKGTPDAMVEDLTVIQPAQPAPTPPPIAPAAKVFNPDVSVIGNVIGAAGDENPFDERDAIALEEAEMSIQAFVDPYAKGSFFIGFHEDEVEIEEGFVNFIALPAGTTLKAGKMLAMFGKTNTQHFHALPWVDRPLVLGNFLGEEGLKGEGISASTLIPNRWDLFIEATGEVFRGDVEELFEAEERSDLLYLAHLKLYRDLTTNANVELGASYMTGPIGAAGDSAFSGVDATFRWKPLERSIYRSLLARAEWITNDRDDVEGAASGLYATADYQFARRWLAGIRYDRSDVPDAPSITDDGVSLTLTFRPSEFSLLRGQYRRMSYGLGDDVNEFLFQLQFGIGAHGAHPF